MIIAAGCLLFVVLEQFVIVALLMAGVILNYSLTSHRLYSALFSPPPLPLLRQLDFLHLSPHFFPPGSLLVP